MSPEQIIEKYRLKPLLLAFLLFMLVAVLGSVFTLTKFSTMLSLMFSLFCYLILPGYFVLLNIEIDDLERIVLSTAIGIGIIPLILFNLNLFWIRIGRLTVITVIVSVIIIGILLKEKDSLLTVLTKKPESCIVQERKKR